MTSEASPIWSTGANRYIVSGKADTSLPYARARNRTAMRQFRLSDKEVYMGTRTYLDTQVRFTFKDCSTLPE